MHLTASGTNSTDDDDAKPKWAPELLRAEWGPAEVEHVEVVFT